MIHLRSCFGATGEVAFYDALAANDSAVEAMGNSESIREQETNSKSSPQSSSPKFVKARPRQDQSPRETH
jgi:hypothetical protein